MGNMIFRLCGLCCWLLDLVCCVVFEMLWVVSVCDVYVNLVLFVLLV